MLPDNQRLYEWWRDGGRFSTTRRDLASKMGITLKALENRLYKGKLESELRQKNKSLPLIEMAAPWDDLEGDWMIVGDVHAPLTDYGFASLVSEVAKRRMTGPRRLLIAGDFFNQDAFSKYDHVVKPTTWAQERDAAKALISLWLETFDEIKMTLGNHDRRLQKLTAGQFEESDLLALVYGNPERVKMSAYGWCEIKSGEAVWRVTHPSNYSIRRLNVADELATKYGRNIISFHEHHLGKSVSRFGGHVIVNGGCLIDPKKVPYAILDDNKSPDWVQGFVLLKNGVPELFGDWPFTDWDDVLKGEPQ